MRDPAIHILKSDLENILGRPITPEQMQEIYQARISTRVLVKGKIKSNLKLSKYIGKVNFYVDAALKQRYIKDHILPGTPDWATLNKVALHIEDMAATFEISIEEACNYYVETGFNLMGKKYRFRSLDYNKSQILQKYRERLDFKNDPTPELTKAMFLYYCKKVAPAPVEFTVDFVYAAEVVYKNDTFDYKKYIDAQFQQLAFLKVVPEPYQLHGDNAVLRYKSYLRGSVQRTTIANPLHSEIQKKLRGE